MRAFGTSACFVMAVLAVRVALVTLAVAVASVALAVMAVALVALAVTAAIAEPTVVADAGAIGAVAHNE